MTVHRVPVEGSSPVDIELGFPDTMSTGPVSPALSPDAGHRPVRLPLAGTVFLCLASALAGVAFDHKLLLPAIPAPKVAMAEQGAVVLEAVLGHPGMDAESARRIVGHTLSSVIEKYRRSGYLVLNVTHAPDGQLLVDAVPNTAIDITGEMRADVARAIALAGSAPSSSAPVAPVSPVAPVAPGDAPIHRTNGVQ
jgi:hypothetical protein